MLMKFFYYDTMVNLVETNEIKDKTTLKTLFFYKYKITNGNVDKVSKAEEVDGK